ncbi:MAG: hypothetical protein EAZ85_00120 [Bacteroidetes bacterium]|nr:MAG: hypothetical protein EAZ85_00120 [Bacteroidota bacterium]TAG90558.1 MAG: hypothetical protein EAZ20_04025 [Bacteroidota bacterium]
MRFDGSLTLFYEKIFFLIFRKFIRKTITKSTRITRILQIKTDFLFLSRTDYQTFLFIYF